MWTIVYTKAALRDAKKLSRAGLKDKAISLLELISSDPYVTPPRYEKLVGNFRGAYSRRINIQHRLVYEVINSSRTIKVLRMWSHYE